MSVTSRLSLSHRGFCICGMTSSGRAATDERPTPCQIFAEARGIVDRIKSEAAKTPIMVHELRGGISALEGSGGNIAVLTGSDGKLLVDAGIGVSRSQVATALSGLGPDPITQLINTHWHFDHADGNEWLQAEGAQILAHENTRRHLTMAQRVEDWNYDFPPAAASALPVEVFATERRLAANGNTVALKYYGPAHTDSDISVYFEEADVLHTGDTFWTGGYPFIDYSTGGSIDGSIQAAEANLEIATDNTVVIPGHGHPVSKRSELREFRDMLISIRENVATLKAQRWSLQEIVSARPTAAFDARWGNFVIDPALFTKLVHEGC
ncbi:MBL fold metallo-hydrolase [Methylorubrum extorquens]|uniref:MBL fold metallo-hydrolase n=1 Tax=Methylorubrum extorquens TaxID=408 RepID=A0AAX3WLX6_METEX|nr:MULTISPECIES: MBL fold metallo-hydrolase [Methylobacteriaceae]KQQ15718.1 cyclase [Methylobacterium sp. Leaf122]WHQ71388.1 MBL fold metallo-hydrolase [Methylorubrum extorquens]